jgi:uncharacterized UBP type Zn finger protein
MTANDTIDLSQPCGHVTKDTPRHVKRPTAGCEECLKIGQEWVHLRVCLTCMKVGCCDDSIGKHASKHAHATKHPIITSGQVGETWAYCFPDDQFLSSEG